MAPVANNVDTLNKSISIMPQTTLGKNAA